MRRRVRNSRIKRIFIQLKNTKIVSETLPGNFSLEEGISYWKVSPEVTKDAAYKLFSDGVTEPVLVKLDNNTIQKQGAYKEQTKKNALSVNQSTDIYVQKPNVDLEIVVNNN